MNSKFPTMVSVTALAATLFSVPASADEGQTGAGSAQDRDAIVVTATRTPLRIEDVPATVTVIDSEDIADILATDIQDLVRYEPGVSVRRAPARFGAAMGSTGRARNEGFTIRGIGGNRVLIQVDNIRTPQGFAFGAQDAGRGGYTDVSLVKSVEILRGPASALYGSDGLAGAVSFTTSDPVDILRGGGNVGGFVRSSYSSADEEFAETAVLAGRSGDWSALLAYTRRDFQELDNQGRVGGIGESRTRPNPQDGRSNAALGKLVWNRGAHRVRLTGEYLDSRIDTDVLSGEGPAFLYGPSPSWIVDALTARDRTERGRVSIDWTYTGGSQGVVDYAQIAAFYQNGQDEQFTREERSPVNATPRPDRERFNTFDNRMFGAVAEARKTFETGALAHTLAVGGDITFTRQKGVRDGTEPPAGETFPTRAFPATDFMQGGIFLADEIALLGGQLTIFPALRLDFYDLDPTDDPLLPQFRGAGQSDSRLSPKLGATARLTEDVILYGNYAQGFRAPTPSQVNNFFSNVALGYISEPNPDLGPERSDSYEAGIRFVGDGVSLSAAAFRADYRDFISQRVVGGAFTPANPAIYQFVNYDRVRIEGLEGKASYRMDNGLHARFAIAYADGTVRTPGEAPLPLDTIDPLNLVLGVGYTDPGDRFGLELIGTHHARKSRADSDGVCSGPCFRPDGFTILDATAFVTLTDALTLRAGIFNITDESYAYWQDVRGLAATAGYTDAFTQPGRNASISASFRF